jgi:carbamoyltransferase
VITVEVIGADVKKQKIMNLPSIAIHVHHNGAAAVYHENEIVAVIELERLVNLKNASWDFFEPIPAKDFVLKAIYEYLKEKFGFTHYDKFIIGYGYKEMPELNKSIIPANEYIVDESHHPAHAYSSFAQSPFERALVISFDGGSNDGFFNLYLAEKGKDLNNIINFGIDLGSHYHLIGLFCEEVRNYHALTASGKVLGLQSYGRVIEEWKAPLTRFFESPVPFWVDIENKKKRLSDEIGIPFSEQNKLSGENAYNFARTAQEAFEEVFFKYADEFIKKYNLPLVLTGGCALNIVLNTRVKERYGLDVFVAPNSTDCGLPVGFLCKHFKPTNIIDVTYKGVGVLDKFSLMEYVNTRHARTASMDVMLNDLMGGRILGVVQGNSEHGPRALGNRSIICSPIPHDMKDILNLKVKHREWYRPFAPIVRLEDVSEYFEWEGESRWMNFCPKVREQYKDRLPAITHVDGTARVQTITREQNTFIYDLLTAFKEKTGIGVLVNTSFNVDGKPILSTYKDAIKVFDDTQLDRLYLDGYYFTK